VLDRSRTDPRPSFCDSADQQKDWKAAGANPQYIAFNLVFAGAGPWHPPKTIEFREVGAYHAFNELFQRNCLPLVSPK